MFDFILELLADLFSDGTGEMVAGVAGEIATGAIEVVSTALLIGGAITIFSVITEEVVQRQLRNRKELKDKGVTSVIVKDFIKHSDRTTVSLAALNAQNQQVGTLQIESRQGVNLKKNQRIPL